MGHRVTVVTAQYATLPAKEQNRGLTVYRVPALRRRQDRSNPLEQIAFILSSSFRTINLMSSFKPDVTLAFFGIPSGVVAWLLKAFYKIPYIVSLRGGDVPGFRPYDFHIYHRLMAPFLRMIWKNAVTIVANSNGLRQLASVFDARFEIPVIPNGVDLESYTWAERDWSFPRLLSVGRIVHQKGLDLAMRALGELKEFHWEWRIVGDGPHLHILQSLAKELGIENRVHFLGWQSREQLIDSYKEANVFLFPSRHEGMPNAMLEAMASGLPVIASCIAGSEELVLDGKTGYLFPSEDIESLRTALKKILSDPALREQMGRAGRLHTETNYSWESTARQYALLLEKVK
jgi:glycosyltransferase involved in cell wall biosynthesis